jgi:glycosyltransferase involved in cell wall biosynthesis
MRKIIFISVHPVHYNDYLFHEINKARMDIHVYYTNKILNSYPWKEKLNYSFPNDICHYILGIDWKLLRTAAFGRNTTFVVAGWDTVFKIALLFTLILFRKSYVLFTDTIRVEANRNPVKQALRSMLVHAILSNADKVFTTGEIGVRTMKSIYNNAKVINFPFATDLGYFNSTPDFSNFGNEKIIFSSGRLLNSHKGYDVGLHALQQVKDRGHAFKYYLAGTGPDQPMLEALICRLGLQDNVVLLGWQEMESVKNLYARAHIFLHPSHLDPFPNAILEAMACGLVVIASNQAGSAAERITNQVSGFIFEDNSVEELTKTIISVFEKPVAEIQAVSRAAKAVSKKWAVSHHLNIIKEVLTN